MALVRKGSRRIVVDGTVHGRRLLGINRRRDRSGVGLRQPARKAVRMSMLRIQFLGVLRVWRGPRVIADGEWCPHEAQRPVKLFALVPGHLCGVTGRLTCGRTLTGNPATSCAGFRTGSVGPVASHATRRRTESGDPSGVRRPATRVDSTPSRKRD